MDPVYITGAPKTFILKFCIGLITGLVAHKIAKINESTDKKYVFKWSVIASVAGLAFNVVADPIVGYFCKNECCSDVIQCSCFCDPGSSDLQCSTSGTDQKSSAYSYR